MSGEVLMGCFCQYIPNCGSNLQTGMASFSFRSLSAGRGREMVMGLFTCSPAPSLANKWTEMAATGVSSNLFSVPAHKREKKIGKKLSQSELPVLLGVGIPGTRLETTKTLMKGEFWDEKRGKQTRERQERQEGAWKHAGGNFLGKCVCFLEGEAVLCWESRLLRGQRDTSNMDQAKRARQAQITIFVLGFLIGKSNLSAALHPTSLLLLCLSLVTCLSDWDVPVLLPSTACRWGKCWMCEGELATVSRAVRLAYDVLTGSVRARRGKLTMGGCLKPSEDRKTQTSKTMDEWNLLKNRCSWP